MNYNEVEGYYSTLNLVIEVFEKIGLHEHHLARIHKLGELVEYAYNGNIPDWFCRDEGEPISEEELCRGILQNDRGDLIIDHEGCSIPDPNYSILESAKKRSVLKLVKSSN